MFVRWQLQKCTEQAETEPRQNRNQRQKWSGVITRAQLRPVPQGRHLQMNFSYYWLETPCGLWPAPNQPSIRVTENWFHVRFQQISFFSPPSSLKKLDALLYSIFISYTEKPYLAAILNEDSQTAAFLLSGVLSVPFTLFSLQLHTSAWLVDVQPSTWPHTSRENIPSPKDIHIALIPLFSQNQIWTGCFWQLSEEVEARTSNNTQTNRK